MPIAHTDQFYINGQWVKPLGTGTHTVINPATRQPLATTAMGSRMDADAAVQAAAAAFPAFSQTSREYRIDLLNRIIDIYERRFEEIASTITAEMGAPITFSRTGQTQIGLTHFQIMRDVLKSYAFETPMANGVVVKEPVGVCALITPWNWPSNQVALKVAPALATGCTMVLKPSEFSPLTAILFAEILHEAGVPAGVFNMVHGTGEEVGAALSAHPLVDMVSITGSTRAGVAVAQAAAPTIKRVTQELGGKSANILLESADFEAAVPKSVDMCFVNAGQSCSAATRLIVPRTRLKQVNDLAKAQAESYVVGDPTNPATTLGPVVSDIQWTRIQSLLHKGVEEGATVLTGGPGKVEGLPQGVEKGCFIKPTLFTDVTPQVTIAQEEIFGPVLVIIPYDSVEHALKIANENKYGLSGYVWGESNESKALAKRMRTGTVNINGTKPHPSLPFGGYKQSGNGREKGLYGFEEYLEIKTITER